MTSDRPATSDRPSSGDLAVLIVDDDSRVAALHAAIVEAMRGFRVAATAGSIAGARAALADHPHVDLALLDVYLPDGSGIDLVGDLPCDCFVVGAETDAAAVRTAMRSGALAYLIKPFDDAELARRLAGYAQYRRVLDAEHVDQRAVDGALSALRFGTRPADRDDPGSPTEKRILELFAAADGPLFADDVSAAIGVAAPTARRHLANLVAAGKLSMTLRYGTTGRPRQEYRLAP
ncbi:response regulator receiver [Gordonia bronchialis DSM 43247]|uniref:Transcriptional regulatory protein n=1 Tax=Gordonia bronchialis (strain ATCC 25592 / DSM 43247 / BCRC 13721 / JCM 3198 / KCTC 3076 / NBRC 16047 / NCTC 10667) TaxID=526226 RepID=D0L8F3_GORB4|nr:response regulator [Gordonia bronchialis]ACY23901.1 response regulator receiver [Gordonia bronchialis DSM 43247]MCC3322067.1 response regulator [Gordonia bronchialis]QGS26752.1 response regulator [Gordonia bronchialis]